MHRVITLLSIFCLTIISCGTSKKAPKSTDESPRFSLEVIQNGKVLQAQDEVITLERKPFKLRISMYHLDAINLAANFDRFYYDVPDDVDIYTCNLETYQGPCKFVGPKSMAEDHFNSDKDLVIGDESRIGYWSYDENRDWHRFDAGVSKNGHQIIAYRTVERFSYPDEGIDIELADIDRNIYIVAASQAERTPEDIAANAAGKELQREKMILVFE